MYDRRSQINQLNLWKSSHKAAKPQTGTPHPFVIVSESFSQQRAEWGRYFSEKSARSLERFGL
jgi:hypothetical protein